MLNTPEHMTISKFKPAENLQWNYIPRHSYSEKEEVLIISISSNIPLILKSLHAETIIMMVREEDDYNVSSFKRKKKCYKHTM